MAACPFRIGGRINHLGINTHDDMQLHHLQHLCNGSTSHMPLTTAMQMCVDGWRAMCSACDCYRVYMGSQTVTCVLARASGAGLAAGGAGSSPPSNIDSISESSGAAAAESRASTAAMTAGSSDGCLAGRPRLFTAAAAVACAVCAGCIPVGPHGVITTTRIQASRVMVQDSHNKECGVNMEAVKAFCFCSKEYRSFTFWM